MLILGTTMGVASAAPPLQEDLPREILVQPAPGISIETISAGYDAPVLDGIPELGIYKLAGDMAALEAMGRDPMISHAMPNRLAEPLEMQRRDFGSGSGYDLVPVVDGRENSTLYFEQWPLIRLKTKQAQRVAAGESVIVAVVDTGIDLDHPDLAGRFVSGYDFVGNDTDPREAPDGLDDDGDGFVDEGAGHGTHVAGIIAVVAPAARLMPVRVLDTEGMGSYFDIIAGIMYAVEHGAQVINLSLSGPADAEFLQAAVDYAWSRGAVVVAAAGAYEVQYPARYERVISVGATDAQDHVAEFSDFRAGQVTVFAPGVSVYSTYYGGGYAWWTGTSMAAAFVSGEAALLLATGKCGPDCVVSTIPTAVHPVVPNLETRGRVNVFEAVKAAVLAKQR
jgi:hypothetical protein